jgi:hypothetical protein
MSNIRPSLAQALQISVSRHGKQTIVDASCDKIRVNTGAPFHACRGT